MGGARALGGWWVLQGAEEGLGGEGRQVGGGGELGESATGRRWGASWVMAEWPGGPEGDLGGEGRWPAFPGLCDLFGEDLEKRRAWGHTGGVTGQCCAEDSEELDQVRMPD